MRRRFVMLLAAVVVALGVPGVAGAHHDDGYSPIVPFGPEHHGGQTLDAVVGETLEFGSRWGTCTRGLAQMYRHIADVRVWVQHETWSEAIELEPAGWSEPIVPDHPLSVTSFDSFCTMPVRNPNGFFVFWKAPYTFAQVGLYTVGVEVRHRAADYDGGVHLPVGWEISGEVYIDVTAP